MKSKFHNSRAKCNGASFDSKKEADRWLVLSGMLESGEISNLRRQVRFVLTPGIRLPSGKWLRESSYIADFVYDTDAGTVVEDVKGFRTPEYQLKKKMMWFLRGIEIKEV